MCNKGITQLYLPPTHEPHLPLLPSQHYVRSTFVQSLNFSWLTVGSLLHFLVYDADVLTVQVFDTFCRPYDHPFISYGAFCARALWRLVNWWFISYSCYRQHSLVTLTLTLWLFDLKTGSPVMRDLVNFRINFADSRIFRSHDRRPDQQTRVQCV